MKLEKLYTISQFVEYLYNEFPLDQHGLINAQKADRFDLIVNYNQFLQQPLKKEMLVNDISVSIPFETSTDKDLWVEREKKLIFKGISIIDGDILELPISDAFNPYLEMKGLTLHDLAEATKGELKLKNVEL